MGRMRVGDGERGSHGSGKAATLSSFPSPSSSSIALSGFEFTISLSPSPQQAAAQLCPADELFYNPSLAAAFHGEDSPPLFSLDLLLRHCHHCLPRLHGNSSSTTFSADLDGLLPNSDSSRPSSFTEDDARRSFPFTKHIKYLSFFTTCFSSVFLHHGSKMDRSNDLNINQIPLPPPPSKR